jgi:hypothetical protein
MSFLIPVLIVFVFWVNAQSGDPDTDYDDYEN